MRTKEWVNHLFEKFGSNLYMFIKSGSMCPCISLYYDCRICSYSPIYCIRPYRSCQSARDWMKLSNKKILKIKKKLKKVIKNKK